MNPVIKYAFAALLLLGSTFSHSATLYKNDRASSTGAEWISKAAGCTTEVAAFCASGGSCYEGHGAPAPNSEPAPYGSCYYYNSSAQIQGFNSNWSTIAGSCPAGYVEDPANGHCVAGPPYSCSSGKTIFANVTKDSGGNFPPDVCLPQTNGGEDYCMFGRVSGPVITESQTMSLVYATASESPATCETPDPDITDVVRFPFTPDGFTSQITEQDTFFTKTDDFYSPPNTVCNSNGDGTDTCVTITSRTETILSGQGSLTTSDGSTATQTTDAGTTLTKSEVKETVDDGNGTSTETTTTTNTGKSGKIEKQVVNGNDGSESTTIVKQEGKGITTESTTIKTTNPDGTVTTETYTQTKSEDGQTEDPAPDAEAEGNCGAPDQPPCAISFEGEDQLTDPATTLESSGILTLFDDHITSLEESGNEDISDKILSNPFSLPSTGVCNPASYSFSYHNQTLNPMTKFCEVYDSTLHPILQFFFYMFTGIGIYFVFMRTLERT